MKASQLRALERVYQRQIPASELITTELARFLSELSRELRRQVAVIIDRNGRIVRVIVGDDKSIYIPDLTGFHLGRSGLRGLRLVHTHLQKEPLTQDDLTDLALLRFDVMAAIEVLPDGLPGAIHYAHLLPDNPEQRPCEIVTVASVHELELQLDRFIPALEAEIERKMGETIDLSDTRERAFLISVSQEGRHDIEDSMAELDELARTASVLVVDQVIQRPRKINPKTLIGEGRLREVVIDAMQRRVGLLIFDQDLTPMQVSTISAMTDLKVIDRSQLILDIFARRAHTLDGKVQVELAQLKYILPRLTGRGTALSRLAGGIGGRGPGETKLEIDRRRIRDRITRLEKQLVNLSRGRMQRRGKRMRGRLPIVSIVGYTNAGKSTLLNALTQSKVLTEDLLFATLDTTTRRLRFPMEREVIITDTVGFIRKLPKSLMGAFKATLEELEDADLLLHIVDISNPRFEQQIAAVEKILSDLDLGMIPRLLVFNKIDQIPVAEIAPFCRRFQAVAVSALNRKSFEPLMDEMAHRFWPE
ncbi:MAG: GTPase HflX, partial [Desulfuromonadales bacterium]|nr:GTPase HflX [Desulfuromonadales bacterium]